MHEWSLAEAVVEAVRQEARGDRVIRLVVRLGDLQQVEQPAFEEALSSIASEAGGPVAGLAEALVIKHEAALLQCRPCGREFTPEQVATLDGLEREAVHFVPEAAYAMLRCPACSSPDFVVVTGRGVTVVEIELSSGRPDPR